MRSSEETYEAVEIVGEELGAPAGEDLAAERLGRTHVEDEEVAGAEPGVVQVDDGELEKHRLAAALWERGERRGHGGSGDDDVGVGGEKGVDGGRLDPVEELVGNQLPVQLWQLGVRRDEVGVGEGVESEEYVGRFTGFAEEGLTFMGRIPFSTSPSVSPFTGSSNSESTSDADGAGIPEDT